ncbi:MAG: hypothetical protein V4574_17325 [Pseudomonadota bacterium]
MVDLVKVGLGAGFAMLCVAAQPASAQVRSTANASALTPVSAASAQRDPNRIVCENQDVIGSRLGGKRVCRTAAEWMMYRREIRNTTEKVQNGKFFNGTSDTSAAAPGR